VFERFSEEARQVVVLAQDRARSLHHAYIGSEHLLLALASDEGASTSAILSRLGVTPDRVRDEIIAVVGIGEPGSHTGQIPFTPRAKRTLELSWHEAVDLGHARVTPEHLLLGLTRSKDGVAHRVLVECKVSEPEIRERVLAHMANTPDSTVEHASGSHRAVTVPPLSFIARPDPELRALLTRAAGRALGSDRDEIAVADVVAELAAAELRTGALKREPD
jgi:ATP-dependent Clp protease ATP-binding subunit ClpC